MLPESYTKKLFNLLFRKFIKKIYFRKSGYQLEEIIQKWYLKEEFNMTSINLSKSIFHSFSENLLAKGLWSYTNGDEYKIYINSSHLIKNRGTIKCTTT